MEVNERHRKGASAVEFAIILPLLLLLLFGIIEFGLIIYDKAMITNASREGARAGIVYRVSGPLSDEEIKAIVDGYCAAHLISLGGSDVVTTSVVRAGSATGDPLTVTVDYTYTFLILPAFLSIDLSAATVMNME